ncbi:hypothetical protein SDC9_75762 [bioreactor metagenome]|jgi:hypothetical protein|uniref:Uncharacterized protein n=1 Tax=bioreactor metagenome TaxID=1076179 RepID=A0A644YKP9_9ZZZZ|nr:hypothetical protein [Paludibacter sp.]
MKTKKLLLMMLFLFVIMGMESCEDKEPKYEIYENHEISACGVEDPLQNIEWLANYCQYYISKKDVLEVYIFLYKTIDKDEYVFATSIPSQIEHYSSISYRNCLGDIIFEWETVNPPNPSFEDFMKDKERVVELFHIVKQ